MLFKVAAHVPCRFLFLYFSLSVCFTALAYNPKPRHYRAFLDHLVYPDHTHSIFNDGPGSPAAMSGSLIPSHATVTLQFPQGRGSCLLPHMSFHAT